MAKSLKLTLQPSAQATFWDIGTCTSVVESGAGPLLSPSPDGQPSDRHGRAQYPVNRFRVPANAAARRMNGTSGQNSTVSSASADLSASLANRLRASMDLNGSMEYRLTWKNSVTESGRVISRLRAQGHRTSDNDSSGLLNGWPTTRANDATGSQKPPNREGGQSLKQAAELSGWPTPVANDAEKRGTVEMRDGASSLAATSQLAGWNTPRATDGSKGGPNQSGGALPHDASLTGWATPGATDGTKAPTHHHGRNLTLNGQSQLTRWGTPSARDHKDAGPALEADPSIVKEGSRLPRQVLGATTESSPVSTASRGVLNAAFSRWLMGFPQDGATRQWDTCSPDWRSWATVQSLLSEFYGRPDETESDG